MKNTKLLKVASLLFISSLAACSKNNVNIPSDKNSNLKIENIGFTDLAGSPLVKGYSNLEFWVEKEDSSLPMDTVRLVDSFNIAISGSQIQNYNFETPARAKTLKFKFKVVLQYGAANGVNIQNLNYTWNGQAYINKSVNLNKEDNTTFTTLQTINF